MQIRLAIAAWIFAVLPVQAATPVTSCSNCVEWNKSQTPFRIYGNTYYVGVHGLSSILIASDQGLIVIDGDLAESAPKIAANISALGFRIGDVKLILNSHAHYDHAGGLAELQRLSGAKAAASPWSARALNNGVTPPDDPQHGDLATPVERVRNIEILHDGQTVHVGPLALTAHFTPGHTPGGTSWTWVSCEKTRCLHIVYTDSLTAVSADKYRFTDHPALLAGFNRSFQTISALPCDILLTPHPEFSNIPAHLEARETGGKPDAFIDPNACRTLVKSSREALAKRLALEKSQK